MASSTPSHHNVTTWRMCMPRLRPMLDRVLVKKEELSDKSDGGIILPYDAENTDKPLRYGKVIAVGLGKEWDIDLAEGDRVVFGRYAGIEMGNDELMLREDEIIGVFVEE